MSTQVTTAFVKQYSANVQMLSQQKGSRLRNLVRTETQVGTTAFYDQIGAATAQLKGARHGSTPQIDTPHSRRAVSLSSYVYADLIDRSDMVQMLIDPTSAYAQAAAMALGRSMDDVIIAAAGGNAATTVDGSVNVALPNSQKVVSVSGGAGAKLNLAALRAAKQILDANDVDASLKRYFALNSISLMNLLSDTQVTSHDYNSVRALVQGELDTYMGFEFVRSERLTTQSGSQLFDVNAGTVGAGAGDSNGYRECFAWAEDGLLLATGRDIVGKISERADKNYSVQVYAEMDIGAVRMEEKKIVQVLCAAS